MSKNKKRVLFDFSKEAYQEFERLAKETNQTKAQVLRAGLRLYALWLKKNGQGYDLIYRKEGEQDAIVELVF